MIHDVLVCMWKAKLFCWGGGGGGAESNHFCYHTHCTATNKVACSEVLNIFGSITIYFSHFTVKGAHPLQQALVMQLLLLCSLILVSPLILIFASDTSWMLYIFQQDYQKIFLSVYCQVTTALFIVHQIKEENKMFLSIAVVYWLIITSPAMSSVFTSVFTTSRRISISSPSCNRPCYHLQFRNPGAFEKRMN